jgi:hypothetical protein
MFLYFVNFAYVGVGVRHLFRRCWSPAFIPSVLESRIYSVGVGVRNLFRRCWRPEFIPSVLASGIYSVGVGVRNLFRFMRRNKFRTPTPIPISFTSPSLSNVPPQAQVPGLERKSMRPQG